MVIFSYIVDYSNNFINRNSSFPISSDNRRSTLLEILIPSLFIALLPATLNQTILCFCHSALSPNLGRAVVGAIRGVRIQ